MIKSSPLVDIRCPMVKIIYIEIGSSSVCFSFLIFGIKINKIKKCRIEFEFKKVGVGLYFVFVL